MDGRLALGAVAFLLVIYASAQTSIREYELPGDNVYPEGIAYSPETGSFYTGSSVDGTIFRGEVETGNVEPFIEGTNEASPEAAYGMALDDQNRLWVVGGATGTIYVYSVDNGELIRKIQTPDAESTFLNDVVVTQAGSAYITDSYRPVLFRVSSTADGVGELESWLDLTGTPIEYASGETTLENVNLNGITATEDGRYLITVQMNTGKLYRIDTENKEVAQIDLGGETLTNGDGLVLDGQTLYVVRIADNEIDVVELSEDLASGTVEARFSDPAFIWPATAAKVDDHLLVVNTQFNRQEEENPELPFSVLSIPTAMIGAGREGQQNEQAQPPSGQTGGGGQASPNLQTGGAGQQPSGEQSGQQNQQQGAQQQGALQISWVDPGNVTVSVSGPDGYSSEAQVTGGHVFAELAPGTYEVTASKEGYQSANQQVEVEAGEIASVSLTLQQQEGQQGEQQRNEQDDQAQQESEQEQEGSQQAQEVSFETLMTQGEQLYGQAGCSSCHGGEGGGGQGPRLAGNEKLQETAYVARTIIHGRGGMPGFGARLSNEELASVATYIRNSWGNDFGPVSLEEVQGQR